MRSIVLGVLLVAARLCGQNGLDEGSQLVVMVNGRLGDAPTFGAGILFARPAARLYIATANHVVRSGGQAAGGLQVRLKPYASKALTARLLPQADAQRDVAVLVVDDPVAQDVDICAVRLDRLGWPGEAKRGDKVFPIGNPNGVGWALPVLPDAIADVTGGQIVFQSTLIARGHSGGGLLNANGELIGMIQADEPPYGRALSWAAVAEMLKGWGLAVHLHVPAPEGDTPLMVDAASGAVEDAKDLLGQPCVDVNAKDEFGWTPLHFAVSRGRSAMISLLLQAGAQVNVANRVGETPLAVAAGRGDAAMISSLIAHGANVNSGRSSSNPLTIAAREGRLNAVEMLLANGARPAADGRDLLDALDPSRNRAAKVREDIARALIRAGANVNARDRDGDTPLALAVESGKAGCVRLLLDAGAAVDVKNRNGYSLLRLAAQMARRSNEITSGDIAVLLLQHGAKAEGEDRARLLDRSAEEGWADVVKLLAAQGADYKSPAGSEVLLKAVEKGQVETARALLDAGVNPTEPGPPYYGLVNTAVDDLSDRSIRFQMVQLLVLRGAKVNLDPRAYLELPLWHVIRESPPDLKVAEFLIAHGARVTEQLVQTAEHDKHPEAAQLLRKALPSRNGPKR